MVADAQALTEKVLVAVRGARAIAAIIYLLRIQSAFQFAARLALTTLLVDGKLRTLFVLKMRGGAAFVRFELHISSRHL
jgi:hypothetical protein